MGKKKKLAAADIANWLSECESQCDADGYQQCEGSNHSWMTAGGPPRIEEVEGDQMRVVCPDGSRFLVTVAMIVAPTAKPKARSRAKTPVHARKAKAHSIESQDKVPCSLVGVNGNAFALMGHWAHAAKRAGWSQERIDAVLEKARSGDYDNLVATLAAHCENAAADGEDDYVDDD